MMYAHDLSGAVYPQSGVRDGFHTASRHSTIPTQPCGSYARWRRHAARSLHNSLG